MPESITMRLFLVAEPAPDEATVLQREAPVPEGEAAFIDGGDGRLDLVCGQCGGLLCKSLQSVRQVSTICMRCPWCRQYNVTRA